MIMDVPDWGWSTWYFVTKQAMFDIWLKSVEFEGIKNAIEDG